MFGQIFSYWPTIFVIEYAITYDILMGCLTYFTTLCSRIPTLQIKKPRYIKIKQFGQTFTQADWF